MTRLLDSVNGPADLKKLSVDELNQVAQDVRDLLIETITSIGGHYASNLGTVELAVALHYVFDSPWDKLVWDVGHQAYPHKILTGRRDRLNTIRQLDGLSGFLSPTRASTMPLAPGTRAPRSRRRSAWPWPAT